jgi:hypothetical protein
MFKQKDIICNTLKITSEKDVSIINNYDDDYLFSSLTVEGGGVFKKGLSVGMQEKMVSGLIIYDNENFYGFSDKFGLCLLSPHTEYTKLETPNNIFDITSDINKLQPVSKDSNSKLQNLIDTNKEKSLNIDLSIKDINNFYIVIPKIYDSNNIILTFFINYIYDLNTIISNISLSFINESSKPAHFKISNDNCYYDNTYNEIINPNSIKKINLEVINENYFIIHVNEYTKNKKF